MAPTEVIEYYRKKLLEKPLADDPQLQRDFLESMIRLYNKRVLADMYELQALYGLLSEVVEKPVEDVE